MQVFITLAAASISAASLLCCEKLDQAVLVGLGQVLFPHTYNIPFGFSEYCQSGQLDLLNIHLFLEIISKKAVWKLETNVQLPRTSNSS
jgi:hypothetical protein